MKQLLPLGAACLVLAACGGVPGNSVATVDGDPITKQDFQHWMTVVSRSAGQPSPPPLDAPGYVKCVAAKRKLTPTPAKGQPKVTDEQLKTQCKQEYDQARGQVVQLLVSLRWIDGEAEARDVKVTKAEVDRAFAEQKRQAFPKESDYLAFLKQTTQSEADVKARVRSELLGGKIRDQVVKRANTVSDQAISDFYAKNKARFGQPEKRDLRVVLTKDKAAADRAHAALERGDGWKAVTKKYSIDDTSKASAGKLPAQAKGTLDKELDDAVFSAKQGELVGPVKTQYGYYVFTVTNMVAPTQQTLAEAKPTIQQTLGAEAQQKAFTAWLEDFTARWREKTECAEGYRTSDCANGPKPTPTPSVE
ncbi:peptidyl-prolyl cis-trans isomerase [Solirubrobacter phytolaccae]|uniref:Peptidyl-prolyl cis-trans isomerase n=1 Tax=Solirubrobacter phytolaccae TaxID=1404360 RepID=A0A9X3SB83_9ACTN|nr:peptidyl-prolyl cis-trans isomerase [Solirubrobacter phytolaccae]MDA0183351.1 peptidyl-prolyl cis-trans isomerase [Solirubrobacter phytolaccae]